MLVWLQLLVWPQDAPVETAKAIATIRLDEEYAGALHPIVAVGLAQRGAGANALAQALGQAYKQVRGQRMQLPLDTWLANGSAWPPWWCPTTCKLCLFCA
jgi:hypothetical protein